MRSATSYTQPCRFTDFLVNEVGLDGEVVRLKDIDGPRGNRKNPQDAPAAGEVAAPASVRQAGTTTETAEATATDDQAGKEAAVPAEKSAEEPKAEEVCPTHAAESLEFHTDQTLVWTQVPSLWTTEVEAQVTPLFENNSDKLVEFKAFVEAGPAAGQAKDKRTFVTHVRPDLTAERDTETVTGPLELTRPFAAAVDSGQDPPRQIPPDVAGSVLVQAGLGAQGGRGGRGACDRGLLGTNERRRTEPETGRRQFERRTRCATQPFLITPSAACIAVRSWLM